MCWKVYENSFKPVFIYFQTDQQSGILTFVHGNFCEPNLTSMNSYLLIVNNSDAIESLGWTILSAFLMFNIIWYQRYMLKTISLWTLLATLTNAPVHSKVYMYTCGQVCIDRQAGRRTDRQTDWWFQYATYNYCNMHEQW